jgi:hypothetical protein
MTAAASLAEVAGEVALPDIQTTAIAVTAVAAVAAAAPSVSRDGLQRVRRAGRCTA